MFTNSIIAAHVFQTSFYPWMKNETELRREYIGAFSVGLHVSFWKLLFSKSQILWVFHEIMSVSSSGLEHQKCCSKLLSSSSAASPYETKKRLLQSPSCRPRASPQQPCVRMAVRPGAAWRYRCTALSRPTHESGVLSFVTPADWTRFWNCTYVWVQHMWSLWMSLHVTLGC